MSSSTRWIFAAIVLAILAWGAWVLFQANTSSDNQPVNDVKTNVETSTSTVK